MQNYPPKLLSMLFDLLDWGTFDVPPGPNFITFKDVVNLQKGGVSVVMLSMMAYFDNWSEAAHLYFALHGSYGIIWLIRDYNMPNPGFNRKQTLTSAILAFTFVLAPYFYAGYLVASKQSP